MSVWVNVRQNSQRPRRDVKEMWRNVLKFEKPRSITIRRIRRGLDAMCGRGGSRRSRLAGSRAAMNGMRRRLRKRLASRRSTECAARAQAAGCCSLRCISRPFTPPAPLPRALLPPTAPPRNNSPLEPRNARSISIGTCSTSALTLIQIPDREIC